MVDMGREVPEDDDGFVRARRIGVVKKADAFAGQSSSKRDRKGQQRTTAESMGQGSLKYCWEQQEVCCCQRSKEDVLYGTKADPGE